MRSLTSTCTCSLLPKLGLLLSSFLLLLLLFTSAVECQYEREITWTISKTSSCEDEQQLGCRCETSLLKPKPLTKITCSCNDETQVVNVRGRRDRNAPEPTHEVTWSIENCKNVTVHPKVLPSSAGRDFNLEFFNISLMSLMEDAFENVASSLPLNKISIRFEKCTIENIPPKSFPSNLKSIEFVNCFIGTISSNSFKQLWMNSLIFDTTTIEDIQPEAFYQDLDFWIAKKSRFKRIQTNSLTGGIRYLNWSNCIIDHLESNAINAVVPDSRFESSTFHRVDPNGLTMKEWTSFSLIDNIFYFVNRSAIDLTLKSATSAERALIKDNTWHHPTSNFILTGRGLKPINVSVDNNTFSELCECGKSFAAVVTIESSDEWFVKEVLNNSRCPITRKAVECLERPLNDTFLFYEDLELLCDVYACTREMQSVTEIFTPQLPDRLRILAIFIGTLAGAILVSLLITFCVFLLRRRTGGSKRNETSDITKSLGLGGPPDYSTSSGGGGEVPRYKITHPPPHHHPPPLRPRSTLFEDVEMEDKGVQTMPSELSTDVLEGLREKLSKPDSFWDAKETIDHLYGLIQVREQSASNLALSTSSPHPPDVTMCNTNNNTNTNTNSNATTLNNPNSNRGTNLLPPSTNFTLPTSMSMPLINSGGGGGSNNKSSSGVGVGGLGISMGLPPLTNHNNSSNSSSNIYNKKYAQIRSKPKTATLCEYRDPSDSQVHIYSELSHPNSNPNSTSNTNTNSTSTSTSTANSSRPRPSVTKKHGIIGLPVLCEYNEPKDAHAHVYAELAQTNVNSNSNSNNTNTNTNGANNNMNNMNHPSPPCSLNPLSSSSSFSSSSTDQRDDSTRTKKGIMNIPPLNHSGNFSNSNTHKRPLPAIPTFHSSSTTKK